MIISLEIPPIIDSLVFPMFKLFCGIGFLFLIGAIINMIIDKVRGKSKQKIIKNRDISNCETDIAIVELEKITDYKKIFKYNNYIIRITEYNIDAILVEELYGILSGNETDEKWNLKNEAKGEIIVNPIIEFQKYVDDIKKIIGNNDIREYILLGSNAIVNIKFKNIKLVRRNSLYFEMSQKIEAKKYTKEEVDEIYKKICV